MINNPPGIKLSTQDWEKSTTPVNIWILSFDKTQVQNKLVGRCCVRCLWAQVPSEAEWECWPVSHHLWVCQKVKYNDLGKAFGRMPGREECSVQIAFLLPSSRCLKSLWGSLCWWHIFGWRRNWGRRQGQSLKSPVTSGNHSQQFFVCWFYVTYIHRVFKRQVWLIILLEFLSYLIAVCKYRSPHFSNKDGNLKLM